VDFFRLARTGTPEAVQKAIQAGANVNTQNEDGWTVLMEAASHNPNPDVITVLLTSGADINARTKKDGSTALHAAAWNNPHPEAIVALLRGGLDVNAQNNHGTTSLMLAAGNNINPGVVSALLAAGSDPDAHNKDGWTPLEAACDNPNPEVMNTILKAGANFNARDKDGQTVLKRAAARSRYPVAIAALLKGGADVNARANNTNTPLISAALHNPNPEIIAVLLNGGADIGARDKDGNTALHGAARNNPDPRIVSALLRGGAEIDAQNNDGETALILAARNNKNPDVSDRLLAAGADAGKRDRWGQTALDRAHSNPSFNGTEALALLGKGTIDLFHLAESGSAEAIQQSVQAGANVRKTDRSGRTMLIAAAQMNADPEILETLLQAGASRGTKDNSGKTALDYAVGNRKLSNASNYQDLLENLKPGVKFSMDFQEVFSLFFKYYDDHPIGTLEIVNASDEPISDIKVQFLLKRYMDEAKEVDVSGLLGPNSSKQVEVLALFSDTILNVTEETKAAAELVIDYNASGKTNEVKKTFTVSILGRNAMTWDDNRKAAAYVTAKDPIVLKFASIASYVRSHEKRPINRNLQAAIALHEALDLFGIGYVSNPTTPYSETSKKKDVVDFLRFPRETFQNRVGDCSDLSILYSALLEAVGIDAAFITIPGHIFVAVSTGLTPSEAAASLISKEETITHEGTVWVPVEITLRNQGFLSAWELGAKEWNENDANGQAGFYPVKEAWGIYQPVGLPGSPDTSIELPSPDRVISAYKEQADNYVDAAISPLIAALKAESQGPKKLSAMNKLGVLDAKYGYPDKAEKLFKEVLATSTSLPALLNLGNLYFIRDDWKNALRYYVQADTLEPNNPHVLLAIAKAEGELKNYSEMKQKYQQLCALDANLAQQYAYLGAGTETGSRAVDVETERRAVMWEDEF
jgi:ankyrin repeat protein